MSVPGISLSILFRVEWPVKLAWPGRFLSRLVNEVLEESGLKIPHNAREKPYTVSPILDTSESVAVRLVPDELYHFVLSLMCGSIDCGAAVDGFARDTYRLSTGEVIHVIGVGLRELKLDLSQGDNAPTNITWSVRFYPTVFTFASRYILYPSPTRFILSAAKTLNSILKNTKTTLAKGDDEAMGLIANIDLKGIANELAINTELVSNNIKTMKVNLGRGRTMPAFEGTATYITHTDKPNILNALLTIAEFYGIGKNRTLGFGHIKINTITQTTPPP